eukprot:1181869-Prorocentrum_minimum.AAC.2
MCRTYCQVDPFTGNILVADAGHCIRWISPEGGVGVLAGTGVEGHRDGRATEQARFRNPADIACDR